MHFNIGENKQDRFKMHQIAYSIRGRYIGIISYLSIIYLVVITVCFISNDVVLYMKTTVLCLPYNLKGHIQIQKKTYK